MIRIIEKFRVLVISVLLTYSLQAWGQQSFVISPHQYFKIEGTSTLHDWVMESAQAEGKAKVKLENGKITGINSLSVALPVTSLKSGKNAMDKNAYAALLSEKVPEIHLELAEIKAITDQSVKAEIKLSIAGNTRILDWDVEYFLAEEGILFSSLQKFKFSDFQLNPPKAMFGAISTGDNLTLSFETIFESTN